MMNKPNLNAATTSSMNKNMGRTEAPVHKMSDQQVASLYKEFHQEKSKEAKALSENALKDAKKLGVVTAILGVTAMATLGPVGGLLAAPTLLMGANKMDTFIKEWDNESIHGSQGRNEMLSARRDFAKEHGIEIDDKLTKQEERADSKKSMGTFTSTARRSAPPKSPKM